MPPSHQKYASWTPERMIRWAGEAGEATAKAASAIIGGKCHPEQGFKAVLGLIRLGDSLGKERLEAACAQALKIGSPRYQTIKNIIALPLKRDDQDTATIERPTPAHGNIRGKAYYN